MLGADRHPLLIKEETVAHNLLKHSREKGGAEWDANGQGHRGDAWQYLGSLGGPGPTRKSRGREIE